MPPSTSGNILAGADGIILDLVSPRDRGAKRRDVEPLIGVDLMLSRVARREAPSDVPALTHAYRQDG